MSALGADIVSVSFSPRMIVSNVYSLPCICPLADTNSNLCRGLVFSLQIGVQLITNNGVNKESTVTAKARTKELNFVRILTAPSQNNLTYLLTYYGAEVMTP